MPAPMRRALLTSALAGLALPALAQAPAWSPSRPIRVIVPYSPGGGTDLHMRVLAEAMRPLLGQPVVVENRAGANGVIGSEIVARAEPDGHTLVDVTGGHVTNRYAMPSMPFDPIRDFTPITLLSSYGMALIGATAAPFQDLRGLLAYARANPGKLNFGTTTAFNSAALAELARLGNVQVEEVPYRGGGPMLNDMVAGHLFAGWSSPQTVVPHLASGRMRILGITSTRRSALLPDVPTIAEAGVPGYEFNAWTALLGPAGMPAPIVQRLHAAIAEACADPTVRSRLNALGADGEVAGPEELARVMREDDARWAAAAARGMVLRPG